DPECLAYLLAFYDHLCLWEEGSLVPVLHVGWVDKLMVNLMRFKPRARRLLQLLPAAASLHPSSNLSSSSITNPCPVSSSSSCSRPAYLPSNNDVRPIITGVSHTRRHDRISHSTLSTTSTTPEAVDNTLTSVDNNLLTVGSSRKGFITGQSISSTSFRQRLRSASNASPRASPKTSTSSAKTHLAVSTVKPISRKMRSAGTTSVVFSIDSLDETPNTSTLDSSGPDSHPPTESDSLACSDSLLPGLPTRLAICPPEDAPPADARNHDQAELDQELPLTIVSPPVALDITPLAANAMLESSAVCGINDIANSLSCSVATNGCSSSSNSSSSTSSLSSIEHNLNQLSSSLHAGDINLLTGDPLHSLSLSVDNQSDESGEL
ncbi:unnamed protein product, partial [Protopolystoma xenopodis]